MPLTYVLHIEVEPSDDETPAFDAEVDDAVDGDLLDQIVGLDFVVETEDGDDVETVNYTVKVARLA